jgi:hypothetical protein
MRKVASGGKGQPSSINPLEEKICLDVCLVIEPREFSFVYLAEN